ncbi:MAG: hypothetical protein IPN95_30390 [Bacteroidetes bacterium]|nr:hypothetical protein [Bacteroidota bacterium]
MQKTEFPVEHFPYAPCHPDPGRITLRRCPNGYLSKFKTQTALHFHSCRHERARHVVAVETDPSTIYAGTASGGLGKAKLAGPSGHPFLIRKPFCRSVLPRLPQQNPSVIWAGTGEGNPRNSQTASKRHLQSPLDAGRTWQMMGLENTKTIHRIIKSIPTMKNVVYVAALGLWLSLPTSIGVFKPSWVD